MKPASKDKTEPNASVKLKSITQYSSLLQTNHQFKNREIDRLPSKRVSRRLEISSKDDLNTASDVMSPDKTTKHVLSSSNPYQEEVADHIPAALRDEAEHPKADRACVCGVIEARRLMTAAKGCGTPTGESRDLPCQKRTFSVRSARIESEILRITDSLEVATDLGSPIGGGLLPQPTLKVGSKLTGDTSCWLL